MYDEKYLELIEEQIQEHEIIERFIRKMVSNDEPLQILEAGCGKRWPFKLEGIQHTLTGIDIDKDALEIRKNSVADLHETIEGDLYSVELEADSYDVIYCSFVLEHIKKADLVIENFVKWAKPNGIIIIKIPDPFSVQGYITRISPHWFHVFYYRFILGKKNTGKPGYGPYPTYYNPIVSRSGIHNFCNDVRNNITLEVEYGDGYFRPGRGFWKTLICIFKKGITIISFGVLTDKHTNLLYILRKKNIYNTF